MGQLFDFMCDLLSFTPAGLACGLERLRLLGRGDRAGGITSSAQDSGPFETISFHLLSEQKGKK